MSRIFWDTNLFIYLLEQRPAHLHDRVVALRKQMIQQGDELLTSSLTLGEVFVQPLRRNRADLAERYKAALSQGARIIAFDEIAAQSFAEIRAYHPSVKPPDAVQLACAAVSEADLFITNDDRLSGIAVHGVGEVKALSEVQLNGRE